MKKMKNLQEVRALITKNQILPKWEQRGGTSSIYRMHQLVLWYLKISKIVCYSYIFVLNFKLLIDQLATFYVLQSDNPGNKGAIRSVHMSNEVVPASGIAGRARTLRQDVQRKISRLRQERGSVSEAAFPCSASSVESLPSGSGSSSTQALVRAGSNHSSISCEDREPNSPQRIELAPGTTGAPSNSITPVGVLCRARALVDCMPSPYDKEALAFKVHIYCSIGSRYIFVS